MTLYLFTLLEFALGNSIPYWCLHSFYVIPALADEALGIGGGEEAQLVAEVVLAWVRHLRLKRSKHNSISRLLLSELGPYLDKQTF
jgi:hypothetical protein